LRIQRIHLTNFRNFGDVTIDFGQRRNIVLGGNAQGKTNLLEAIHLLGVGRSHRDRRDAHLVRFGETFYRIEGVFEHIGVKTTIEVSYMPERKRVRVNGKDARPADLIGLVGVVISSPDDIDLIKGSPGFRRTFLDMALCQISREYLKDLQSYFRALAQRNRLLKAAQGGAVDPSQMAAWDASLTEAGARVVRMRLAYLTDIGPSVVENFGLISATRDGISLRYDAKGYHIDSGPATGEDGDEVLAAITAGLGRALATHRQIEQARGYTLFGPHVDDFRFLLGGRDIRHFGSEGEQRTAVLALRCSEVSGMKQKTGRYPIVLLDDVFAELDEHRSRALTALISGFDQILLSSSRPAPKAEGDIHLITIVDGRIERSGPARGGSQDS
jgi:DNA replication and repair protein RecF